MAMQSVTLWKLANWAYGRQKAHILLRRPQQAWDWAIAATGALPDGPRPSVAWDAAMLHGALCKLAGGRPEIIDLIVMPAANGRRPEPPDDIPQCMPIEISSRNRSFERVGVSSFKRQHGRLTRARTAPVDDEMRRPTIELPPSRHHQSLERNSWGVFEGKRVELLIRTLGFAVQYRPVYEKRGRRWKQMDREPYWRPIEYCPVRWDPDPGMHAAEVAMYVTWRDMMMRLFDAMQEVELREHELVFEEIAQPPDGPLMEFDSWAIGRSEFAEVDVTVAKVPRGDIGIRMFEDGAMLTERRVRAEVAA